MFFLSLNCLLLFIAATNSKPNNYYANETVPIVLKADSSNIAKQNGTDVQLIGRGSLNLILASGFLEVGLNWFNCIGLVRFCYSSLEKKDNASLLCGNGFCGFEIEGTEKEILLIGRGHSHKMHFQSCRPIQMKENETSYCGINVASCKPLINDNRITIKVHDASSTCQAVIKNATIYYPPTTSTSTTSLPSTKSVAPSETSEGSNEWYIWVIIGIALVLLIGIIIAIFVCWKKRICLFKKKTEEIDQISLYRQIKR
uniref:Uncharacterized protein n=1 Tax=Panagrolaimus sp. PS1159 TaxID=55785 RepID=A0AC35GNM6_9BILA